MNILESILAEKRTEVARARSLVPLGTLRMQAAEAPPCRGFARSLHAEPTPAIIAEIKRRSPSAGPIRPELDVQTVARAYETGGAAALSVLTDGPHFGGSLEAMRAARTATALPVLRKEFILEEYQVLEARAHGADAVLLIAGALAPAQLAALHALAGDLGMDVLVEVHDERELSLVAESGVRPGLLGINNRDLRAQRTDLATFERLAPLARAAFGTAPMLVAESGIVDPGDVERMNRAGAGALLIGEALLREPDPGDAVRRLHGRGAPA